MKRMVQFAVVVVVTVLAGLPTAEALTCPLRAAAKSAACPTGMIETSADCPMARLMAADECLRDCCNCGLPKLVGPVAVPVYPKPGMPVQFVALAALNAGAEHAVATTFDGPMVSSSPPRYILNRVFRI